MSPHPPFYYSLLKLWKLLWGGNPVALRSLSLVFAALTIPVLLGAARELERENPSSFREIPAPFPALETKGPIRAGSPAVCP
jgi:mannosyltransferase